jgi:single-strand DNA-binding protein
MQLSLRVWRYTSTALVKQRLFSRAVSSGSEYVSPFAEIDEAAGDALPKERGKTTTTQPTMSSITSRVSVASVNRVLLVGHVGRDPVTKQLTADGSTVTLFPLATKELTSGSTSNPNAGTQWHNIAVYDPKLGEIVQNVCRKGYQVYVEGKLQSRQWTDSKGTVRTHFEIAVSPFKGSVLVLNKPAASSAVDEGQQTVGRTERHTSTIADNVSAASMSFRRKPAGVTKELFPEPEPRST